MSKTENAYKTISEVAKILDLKSTSNGKLQTHTIRFWEKEFKQIKPKIFAGKRRYYDYNTISLIKKIHFLLKDQGMTIFGVKKLLNTNRSLKLDEIQNNSISVDNLNIKVKLKKILNLTKELKKLK